MAERNPSTRLETDDAADPALIPRCAPSRALDEDDFAYETDHYQFSHVAHSPLSLFSASGPTHCRSDRLTPPCDDFDRFHYRTNETEKDWRKSPTSCGSRSPIEQAQVNIMSSVHRSPSSLPNMSSVEESFRELKVGRSTSSHHQSLNNRSPINVPKKSEDVVDCVIQATKPRPTLDAKMSAVKAAEVYCTQDTDGDTLLHFNLIIHPTKVDAIISLIDRAPNSNCLDVRNSHGLTPVHLAIHNDQPEIVERLLDAGASLEPVDFINGDTPALMACRLGRGACFSKIVKAVKRRVSEMCSASGLRNDTERIANELRRVLQTRDKDGLSCLFLASKLPDRSIFYNLVYEFDVDVNQIELKRGMTLLHYAAYCNDTELVQTLVDLPGIDVNKLTYDKRTAMQLAHDRRQSGVVDILRQKMTSSFIDEKSDDDFTSTDSESEMDCDS